MNFEILNELFAGCRYSIICAKYTCCNPQKWHMENWFTDINRLYYILEGMCEISVNGKTVYPKAGDLVILPANCRISAKMMDGHVLNKFWCHFYANINNRSIFDYICTNYVVHAEDREYVTQLFQRLSELDKDKCSQLNKLNCETILSCLVAYYLDHAVIEKNKDHNSKEKFIDISVFNQFIQDHFSENIRLQDLADLVHLHPNYFSKCFKSMYGISPMHYVHRLKLDSIKDLLIKSNLSINEISNMFGFTDIFYFSNFFKKNVGLSPSEYRKHHTMYD